MMFVIGGMCYKLFINSFSAQSVRKWSRVIRTRSADPYTCRVVLAPDRTGLSSWFEPDRKLKLVLWIFTVKCFFRLSLKEVALGFWGAGSPSLLAVDGEGQRDVERVVVLDQRGVLVVQDQLLQGPVQVVGLREPEPGAGLVDDAVLHLAVHPEGEEPETQVRFNCCRLNIR